MDFLSWLPWIGGGSTIALIALAVFAPSVLQVAASYLVALAPLVKALADFVVWFAKDIVWEGLKDIADNIATVVLVVCLMALSVWYFHTPCKVCIDQIRSEYRLVPRTNPATSKPKATKQKVKDWSLSDAFKF
jgi:hypothetical protein